MIKHRAIGNHFNDILCFKKDRNRMLFLHKTIMSFKITNMILRDSEVSFYQLL